MNHPPPSRSVWPFRAFERLIDPVAEDASPQPPRALWAFVR